MELSHHRSVPQPQQSVRVPSQLGIAKGRRVSDRVVSLRHSAYRVQRPAPRSCQQPPPILPGSTSSRLAYRVDFDSTNCYWIIRYIFCSCFVPLSLPHLDLVTDPTYTTCRVPSMPAVPRSATPIGRCFMSSTLYYRQPAFGL